jgi:diguanylate cyclase
MKRWLETMFPSGAADVDRLMRLQMEAGAAHARIRVPTSLVMFGIRVLRRYLYEHLKFIRLDPGDLARAHAYVSGSLDLALSAMTAAHVANLERNTRSDEALRLYSIGSDLQAERERQRAILAEWAQHVFFSSQDEDHAEPTVGLSHSDFGIWVTHRGGLLFSQFAEFETIVAAIEEVDLIVGQLDSAVQKERLDLLRRLKSLIDRIGQLLSLLFDRIMDFGSARDPVTHLLSRRFLRPALSREILLQEKVPHPFCVILFEIGNFDDLRQGFGEASADAIVQNTATMIFNAARSSDSVFNLGRESFLVIRVESNKDEAAAFAREMADAYAATHFNVEGRSILNNSLNFAIVPYDGHPDPRYLIERAESALRQARGQSRRNV